MMVVGIEPEQSPEPFSISCLCSSSLSGRWRAVSDCRGAVHAVGGSTHHLATALCDMIRVSSLTGNVSPCALGNPAISLLASLATNVLIAIRHVGLARDMLCALGAGARMRRAGAGCAQPRWSGAACLMQWRRRLTWAPARPPRTAAGLPQGQGLAAGRALRASWEFGIPAR